MHHHLKKIMVCVDGSHQSLCAARYASEFLSPQKTRVVLLNIELDLPESFIDLEVEPTLISKALTQMDWRGRQQEFIQRMTTEARQYFLNAGFPEEAVEIKIQPRKTGVATDILIAAMDQYDGLVLGRTGVTSFTGISMGGTATKVLKKLNRTAICIVGGSPHPQKVLIGFNGFKDAFKAVRFAGDVLPNSGIEILLCNIIRSISLTDGAFDLSNATYDQAFFPEIAQQHVQTSRRKIEKAFAQARGELEAAGLEAKKIHAHSLDRYASRSLGLVEEARRGGFGTIILGRKEQTVLEQIFIGRVGTKVMQLADKMAVWITN